VIYLLGRSIDLGGSSLNVLALVAGVLALRDPLVVADPGFLLTFGATASILLAASLPRRLRLRWWLASVVALFLASLSAEVALLPVGASFFSRVTLAGLVLNFAAIPLMAVAQLAGMLVVPLYELAAPVARVAGTVRGRSAGTIDSGDRPGDDPEPASFRTVRRFRPVVAAGAAEVGDARCRWPPRHLPARACGPGSARPSRPTRRPTAPISSSPRRRGRARRPSR
jgi:predicted membrane metal-binding protein